MNKIKKCRQCGVPLGFSRSLVWHSNGVITQAKDPDHRFIFSESGGALVVWIMRRDKAVY